MGDRRRRSAGIMVRRSGFIIRRLHARHGFSSPDDMPASRSYAARCRCSRRQGIAAKRHWDLLILALRFSCELGDAWVTGFKSMRMLTALDGRLAPCCRRLAFICHRAHEKPLQKVVESIPERVSTFKFNGERSESAAMRSKAQGAQMAGR